MSRAGINQRAVYVGPTENYRGMTALLQQTQLYDGVGHRLVKVQFDDITHPLSHGWYSFCSEHWHLLE